MLGKMDSGFSPAGCPGMTNVGVVTRNVGYHHRCNNKNNGSEKRHG
jgi:hypothetical protein